MRGTGPGPAATGVVEPQPEHGEPRLHEPGLRDLSGTDYRAILRRAGKSALQDQITDAAAALAYYSFLAMPATLLLALGVFGLVFDPARVSDLTDRLTSVMPAEAAGLFADSLERVSENQGGSVALVTVGGALALWTATGAMTALMRALNRAYGRTETRGFLRQRITAAGMLALALLALVLVLGLLVLGPHVSGWIGDAVSQESLVDWIWWTAQWPILLVGLVLAFAGILYLGPDIDHPRWQFTLPGTVLAVVIWLVASGLFAVYAGMFGSFNKTWGTLAAVVVTLTWLWLSGLALLLGAEINAEAERSRELRRGEPAARDLQARPRGAAKDA